MSKGCVWARGDALSRSQGVRSSEVADMEDLGLERGAQLDDVPLRPPLSLFLGPAKNKPPFAQVACTVSTRSRPSTATGYAP